MTKQITMAAKVKNFLKENPDSNREQIVEGISGDRRKILSTVYSLTHEGKILKDKHDCYTFNEDYDPKTSLKNQKEKIAYNTKKELQQQNLPIDIPNNVVSALKGIEQLTIDRQICVQTLKDIKDLVDKALFQLIDQK